MTKLQAVLLLIISGGILLTILKINLVFRNYHRKLFNLGYDSARAAIARGLSVESAMEYTYNGPADEYDRGWISYCNEYKRERLNESVKPTDD